MKTCKDCEHYEAYDGPEKAGSEKAVMFCSARGNMYSYIDVRSCDDFTPKKPEETVKEAGVWCRGCIYDGHCRGSCVDGPFLPKTEKPKEPTRWLETAHDVSTLKLPEMPKIPKETKKENEPMEKSCLNCRRRKHVTDSSFYCKPYKSTYRITNTASCSRHKPVKTNPTNSKENTMLKRLKHLWRMIATAWHYYLIYIICCYAHPFVMWYGEKCHTHTKATFEWNPVETGSIIFSWLFAILSLSIVVAVLYAHHRYTKWYHGEK